jgi:hypothetical protein
LGCFKNLFRRFRFFKHANNPRLSFMKSRNPGFLKKPDFSPYYNQSQPLDQLLLQTSL